VFERIGGFDEELVRNQDDEFNLRLQRAGGRIWQSARIQSWYQPRTSLRALWRQYTQYGYWKVRVIQKHGRPAALRHLVPAAWVGTLGLLPLLGLAWAPAWSLWLGLVGLYGAGVLVAAVQTARQSEWALLPLLPAVFVCYHIAYGVGFLRGLLAWLLGRRLAAPTMTTITR
jgi:hypothetical protein